MGDNDSCALFAQLFDMLAESPTDDRKELANRIMKLTEDKDFALDDMGVDESLRKLGITYKSTYRKYDTEEEALAAPGRIYRHYKGGIYRVLHESVVHTETEEYLVVYEHIYPHRHEVYARPSAMFHGQPDGLPNQARFTLVKWQ